MSEVAGHVPPKFDIYGWEVKGEKPVGPGEVKLPPGWSYEPSKKTLNSLKEERKRGDLPDISFDLDGDGMVGGQDLVIGKLFDKDGDGRLNTAERKAADTAVANGIADRFVWGVEQAAPTRPFRIIQKRGQVIDSEDFSPIAQTYMSNARSVSPLVKTCGELKETRAKERLGTMKTMREKWEMEHPQVVKAEEIEYKKASLPYSTWTQKKALEVTSARSKIGLSPHPTDVNLQPPPSLAYIPSPKYRSKSQMRSAKHSEQLTALSSNLNHSFLNADRRLETRETQLIASIGTGNGGKTYLEVREKMKKEANDHNLATFSNVVIGVHGHELPKFSEELPDYWKLTPGYIPEPRINSILELNQEKRYWAPKDQYKLADKGENPPPPDPFKRVHVRKSSKDRKGIPDEPTRIVPVEYQERDPAEELGKDKGKGKYRWTTVVEEFNKARTVRKERKGVRRERYREVREVESPEKASIETAQVSGRKWSTIGSSGRQITKTISSALVRSSGFVT